MIQPSTEIKHRDEFADLCTNRNLISLAVEIGVDHAIFAKRFLDKWHGRLYLAVDSYHPCHDEFPWDREADYLSAVMRLLPYEGRARIIRDESDLVAETIRSGSKVLNQRLAPSFVYLDGSHLYHDVRDDIANWAPLICAGGILAGHDYDETHPGVMRAVNEFTEANGVEVFLTHEGLPSWYCYRTW